MAPVRGIDQSHGLCLRGTHASFRLGTGCRSRVIEPDHVTSVTMPLLRHEPRHGPQQRGPKFRRIPGDGPANPRVVMTTRVSVLWGSLHSLFPPSLLIAINGPDTWTYYRIQIVIYDVRLTAHELTSGGSLWVTLSCGWPNATTFSVLYSVFSLAQSAAPSAVPA